jgi:nitrogen fixation protein FixH
MIMPVEWMTNPAETPRPAPPFQLTGRHVLWGMVCFFVVVAGVNATMMALAIRTMPGLDARNGYEVSQRYNGEIARMDGQRRLGWKADVSVRRRDGAADIAVRLADAEGAPLPDLAVKARLLHPASRQLDHDVVLASGSGGVYAASVKDVAPGKWTIAIDASRGADVLFTSQNALYLKE